MLIGEQSMSPDSSFEMPCPEKFDMTSVGVIRQNCRIAALQGASSESLQALLADFAMRVARNGHRIAGVVEIANDAPVGACGRRRLRDLSTGVITSISQNLGVGSTACNLDPSGLVEACVAVERAIGKGADLVVLSKFGKLEAERGGLSDAFRAAIVAGVPILTAVSPAMSQAWRSFAGPLSEFLPADMGIVDAWWSAVSASVLLPAG